MPRDQRFVYKQRWQTVVTQPQTPQSSQDQQPSTGYNRGRNHKLNEACVIIVIDDIHFTLRCHIDKPVLYSQTGLACLLIVPVCSDVRSFGKVSHWDTIAGVRLHLPVFHVLFCFSCIIEQLWGIERCKHSVEAERVRSVLKSPLPLQNGSPPINCVCRSSAVEGDPCSSCLPLLWRHSDVEHLDSHCPWNTSCL